ncbi:MAG: methyltransferase domain-containing protein [Cellvibrionaceae bacterium]
MSTPYTHFKADEKRLNEYFEAQWETPYQSTIQFFDWLETQAKFEKGKCYADLGCGMGSNVYYAAQRHPSSKFSGIDIDDELISTGNSMLDARSADNASLTQDDWFNLRQEHRNRYAGIVSLQTLMMFKEHESPINRIIDLDPDWFAINSLFFDGDIETSTLIKDDTYETTREYYYSTFSTNKIRELCKSRGYENFNSTPFDIDIDLPKKENWGGMGTYTEKLSSGRNLQISGPLLMNWQFIIASKKPL